MKRCLPDSGVFLGDAPAMIDNFSILLSHGLLALAFWYLLQRDDLDAEKPPTPDAEPEGFGHTRLKPGQKKPAAPGGNPDA